MKDWWAKWKQKKMLPWMGMIFCCVAAAALMGFSSAASPMTEEESRISRTLSLIQGAGDARVSIYYEKQDAAFGSGSKKPVGAVIVARGAENVAVRLRLQRAAEALLALPADRIEVFPMEETP